jgi:hypothetical protein
MNEDDDDDGSKHDRHNEQIYLSHTHIDIKDRLTIAKVPSSKTSCKINEKQ